MYYLSTSLYIYTYSQSGYGWYCCVIAGPPGDADFRELRYVLGVHNLVNWEMYLEATIE
jgi:hypothetical protein